jgi:hypothetical protein
MDMRTRVVLLLASAVVLGGRPAAAQAPAAVTPAEIAQGTASSTARATATPVTVPMPRGPSVPT